MLYLDAVTGIFGYAHDARVLRSRRLYQKCESNELLIHPLRFIEDTELRLMLLGDGAYPLTDWLQ